MRRALNLALCLIAAYFLSACEGYTYNGMDGEQALTAANDMELTEAYDFYVKTYIGTSPPMLDVAKTFRRFGTRGSDYVAVRALSTNDPQEFEADMMALLILEYECSAELSGRLKKQAKKLGVDTAYAIDVCG